MQRRERDRARGAEQRAERFAGDAVDAATGCRPPAPASRRPGAAAAQRAAEPGAVGGVDDQVGGGQGGDVGGGVDHRARGTPRRPQPAGRVPAVVAVVALPGDHDDTSAVRPAEHVEGSASHRRTGPPDQHVDRLGRGGVDGRHLARGDDRDHPSIMPHRAVDRLRVRYCSAPATVRPMSDEAERVAALVATPPDVIVPVPRTDRVIAADLIGRADGAAVLLVHGTPDSRLARHPDPGVTESAGIRLVAVDRPGFGHSTIDLDATPTSFGHDLVALLDHLDLADVAVVAWSAGAIWALGLAAVAPERARSVTIVGGLAPFEAFDDAEVWEAAGEARRGMVETARDLGPALAAELIGPLLVPDPATPAAALEHRQEHGSDDLSALPGAAVQMAAATLDAVRHGTGGVVRGLTAQLGPSGLDLAAIDTPVHLITGELDATCPPAFANWFASRLPAATVTIVPDAGHGLLLTHWCELLAPLSIGGRAVTATANRPPLSVLDLAIVSAGRTSADALAATTALAKRADELGLARFWVAEHHNMPSVASTTPPVLMAHLAAVTQQIRVGSGGIMLPNHPPLVVAEHIAALEALHPDRVDLGIGRAPGTDQRTAAALRRSPTQLGVEEFPQDLLDVMALLGDAVTKAGSGHASVPRPRRPPIRRSSSSVPVATARSSPACSACASRSPTTSAPVARSRRSRSTARRSAPPPCSMHPI